MLILLDTSALIWWMHNDDRLGRKTRQLLGDSDNQVVVSAISVHEYAIKARLRKLPTVRGLRDLVERQGFFNAGFTVLQAEAVFRVPELSWKDPFDLALIATAHELEATLLTSDNKILSETASYITCLDARK